MASPAVNGAVALIWNAIPALERYLKNKIKRY
jgi:hypothetical protein